MKIADYSKGSKKSLKTKARIFGIIALVGLALMIVFSILGLTGAAIPCILVSVICFVLWIQNHNGVKRLENTTCSCGQAFKYPDDVQVLSKEEKQSTSKQGDKLMRVTKELVKFHCTCSKCKKSSDFSFQFLIKEEQLHPVNGSVLHSKEYPLEEQISKYFG